MRWLVVLLFAGCGRIGFDAVGTDGDGGNGDGMPGDGVIPAGTITLRDNFGLESVQNSMSFEFTFPRQQFAGDLSLLVVAWETNNLPSSVTDSLGTTYKPNGGITLGTSLRQALYSASTNPSPGNVTYTVTFPSATSNVRIRVLFYAGVDLADPIDGSTENLGTSTECDSAGAFVTVDNAMIFAACSSLVPVTGPGPGFRQIFMGLLEGIYEERLVTAPGLYNATAPLSTTGEWAIHMAALRPL